LLLNPAATQVRVACRIRVPIKLGTTHCVGVAVGVGVGVAVGVAVGVGVGVGDGAPSDCLSWKAFCWDAPRMLTRPSTHA
jgi:hypothetical protein